ncbi:hypothetical protein SDC9_135440 [bioreactor metagenome]|uniref:Uncharacterized protein n=1 Tax=bioreactor metagenome TaxID=1076179 RepID=A0A645DH24_9ZZZZ
MATRDAAAVARGGHVDEVERLAAAQLGQQDASRLHAQAALEQRRRRHGRVFFFLRLGRVEQMDVVRMVRQEQLGHVFNRDDALILGNLLHQRLHEGGLARAGFAGHHDDFFELDGPTQEADVIVLFLELQKLQLVGTQVGADRPNVGEEVLLRVVIQRANREGRLSDRDRNRSLLARGRHHDLHALALRKDGREDRPHVRHVVRRELGDGRRQRTQMLVSESRRFVPFPLASPFAPHFTRPVHADFRDGRIAHPGGERLKVEIDRSRAVQRGREVFTGWLLRHRTRSKSPDRGRCRHRLARPDSCRGLAEC